MTHNTQANWTGSKNTAELRTSAGNGLPTPHHLVFLLLCSPCQEQEKFSLIKSTLTRPTLRTSSPNGQRIGTLLVLGAPTVAATIHRTFSTSSGLVQLTRLTATSSLRRTYARRLLKNMSNTSETTPKFYRKLQNSVSKQVSIK